jgi:hypothetical protein
MTQTPGRTSSRASAIALRMLHHLFFGQLYLFLIGPPVTVAAIFNDVAGLVVCVPWGVYCLYMYRRIQKMGQAQISEHFPGTVSFRASDELSLKLLKFNACWVVIFLTALLLHGHVAELVARGVA